MMRDSEMKIVVLNGSPRRGGVVSQMLGHVAAHLPEQCRAEEFFVHDLQVKPCAGCMRCRTLGRCVLPEDDAHRVAELLRDADALVVGSPCYWGNMTGELKVLFDRVVYVMMGERENGIPVPLHRGKRAVVVSACNTVWPFNVWFGQTGGVFRSVREILKWSGYKVVGTLAKGGCRKQGGLTPREIMKCKKLAKKIC